MLTHDRASEQLTYALYAMRAENANSEEMANTRYPFLGKWFGGSKKEEVKGNELKQNLGQDTPNRQNDELSDPEDFLGVEREGKNKDKTDDDENDDDDDGGEMNPISEPLFGFPLGLGDKGDGGAATD